MGKKKKKKDLDRRKQKTINRQFEWKENKKNTPDEECADL